MARGRSLELAGRQLATSSPLARRPISPRPLVLSASVGIEKYAPIWAALWAKKGEWWAILFPLHCLWPALLCALCIPSAGPVEGELGES